MSLSKAIKKGIGFVLVAGVLGFLFMGSVQSTSLIEALQIWGIAVSLTVLIVMGLNLIVDP